MPFGLSKKIFLLFIPLIAIAFYNYYDFESPKKKPEMTDELTVEVRPQTFSVEVSAVGELEASRSTVLASALYGDNSKIIHIVADGKNVEPGELLVKIDPTAYENKIAELKSKVADQEATAQSLKTALEWESGQTEIEKQVAQLDLESAELELNKIVKGDGPMEISRLKSLMQKATVLFEELKGYHEELTKLESEGFVNFSEIKQSQKKLEDAQETFETAKLQYESFVNNVFPMQIKKAEGQLKRAKIKLDEVGKSTQYRISKAQVAFDQATQQLNDFRNLLRWAEHDLTMTEMRAPNQGMVVLREDFRQGQRRKPRIGDLAPKNLPLLDLPDLKSLIVKSKVREVDLHKIAIGKKSTIEVDAYPETPFSGVITNIGVLAIPDLQKFGEEKYFETIVAIENFDERLRPGMTARIVVHADEVKNKLSVPCQAVFEIKKKNFAYVQQRDGVKMREISTGASNDQWTEIKSGLAAGEKVCLSCPVRNDE